VAVSTKDLRTPAADAVTSCDVCGRTLLRGEHAHPYLDGGDHRAVCELCTGRAVQEGWIREGTLPAYDGSDSGSERRRSLLGRLRRRREAPDGRRREAPDTGGSSPSEREPDAPRPASPRRPRSLLREPRHVRAIPSSAEHRIASAIDAFNGSEHRRTVSGVARSLGLPLVSVQPVDGRPSMVNVVVAWELCWYRYEVDLAEEQHAVRVAAQGDELEELAPAERVGNAVCDDRGQLALAE
jgi:hypothetical protein